jgi:hypothetical protein
MARIGARGKNPKDHNQGKGDVKQSLKEEILRFFIDVVPERNFFLH